MAHDPELQEAHEAIEADRAELLIKLWKPDLGVPTSDNEDFCEISV